MGVEDTFWTVVAWVAQLLVCSTVAVTLASGVLAMWGYRLPPWRLL